ncbi:amino acid transporter [Silvibacterium bohemicum]|uniref:Amino acid transporter n=1 Tax=Silvibacterium bohemicum TaxID=1577686 RepID=A0A841JTS2_9BACT|nr:APC family permease [Silvibacterium bohemicum]MBB6144802.1 amino acid transporter [Silvibacterium bohemicum]
MTDSAQTALERKIGLGSAISLNMMNMIGVGPFITLPLVVVAMGGSQAILGWLLGALIAICDGLVWAELGAAMPEAGGSYAFLREIYNRDGAGRMISFLYIWQLGFSAPLSIASGCIGLAQYAAYLWPALNASVLGSPIHASSLLAASTCVLAVTMLYRNVSAITRIAWVLTGGVLLTIGAVILAGATHFHPALLAPSPGAFTLNIGFFEGLGAATLLATYDYWGYYSVCFLGGEVRDPSRTIPRAILWSIVIVAALYLMMNVSVLGVIPLSDLTHVGAAKFAVVAVLMERTFGATAARVLALLVMWTAFASVFSLLLAYSRAPYAAALDGNYFRIFARLHPRHKFPSASLLALGAVATIFCFFSLAQVIAALVAIRILLQYVLQQIGVIVLRRRRPQMPRPFRIWLYPLPPLLALAGFLFIVFSRHEASRELLDALVVAATGSALYFIRAKKRSEWPFAEASYLPEGK